MRRLGFTLALAVLLSARPALAEDDPERLIADGIELRRARRDAEALELFRRAFELKSTPRALAQIALAEQALGKWLEAERDLLAALSTPDDRWISANAAHLRKALDTIQGKLATLHIESNVEGAEVRLNGEIAGKLPLPPQRVLAGPVKIELSVEGRPTSTRTLELEPRSTVVQRFDFVESPREPEARPTAPPRANAAPAPAPVSSKGEPSMQRALGFGLLGVAGVSLGGALVAQLVQQNNVARYNDDAHCVVPGLSRDQVCGEYRGRAATAQDFAIAGYVAAGVLAAGGAVLLLTDGSSTKSRAQTFVVATTDRLLLGYTGDL